MKFVLYLCGLGEIRGVFFINLLYLCFWSDMLINEYDIVLNFNKNLLFFERIYLINYSVIIVESKIMFSECIL